MAANHAQDESHCIEYAKGCNYRKVFYFYKILCFALHITMTEFYVSDKQDSEEDNIW
jgi:hypothetical protein